MSLVSHAKRELKLLGYVPLGEEQKDAPNKWIQENVLELIEVFSKQGHSGFSATCCINLFSKLAKFENIAPLTGEEEEWNEVQDGIYQNNRCGEVFKNGKDSKAYWMYGKIFSDDDGKTWFTNGNSKVEIEFPWNHGKPKKIIVDKK